MREVLAKKQPDLRLFLDNVYSSQNLSAILRTCDAVGILGIYYAKNDNQSLKTHPTITQGSEQWVRARRIPYEERASFLREKKNEGFQILAAHLDDSAVSFREIDFTRPTLLVLGNEKEGVSDEVLETADRTVIIPMMGMAQSLNVSVATAIILYEAQRQREAAGMYDTPQLDEEERERILKQWIHRDAIARRSKGTIATSGKLWLEW
jgi:tRNA (guanosine-2'-O-)-methyltransferase